MHGRIHHMALAVHQAAHAAVDNHAARLTQRTGGAHFAHLAVAWPVPAPRPIVEGDPVLLAGRAHGVGLGQRATQRFLHVDAAGAVLGGENGDFRVQPGPGGDAHQIGLLVLDHAAVVGIPCGMS